MRLATCQAKLRVMHRDNSYQCILIFNGLQQGLKMYAPAFELWDLAPPENLATIQFAKLAACCL